MFDLENAWPFTARHLTETINEIPNQYGYIEELGWAPGEGVATTAIEIAKVGDAIRVLPNVERGGPSSTKGAPAEDAIFIKIPSFPQTHTITPADVQDWVQKANRQYKPKTMEQSLAERLESLRWDHDLTLEYQRIGAIKGKLLDGSGQELIDLHDAFGVVQKVVDFELDVAGTEVTEKVDEVLSFIRANLLGEVMTGVDILVDKAFFNALVKHPNVEKFYLGYVNAMMIANPTYQPKYGRIFDFHGVTFREYDASVTLYDGTSVPLIAAGEGHAVPVGTRDAFRTYFGPPNDIRYVNSEGMEIFMSQEFLKHGAGVELKSESCPLAVYRRPILCVKVVAS